MDKSMISELYQSLILEHSRKPRNFGQMDCSCAQCFQAKGNNPSCGDQLNLQVLFNGECIENIKFEGQGCALSMASASLMTQYIKNTNLLQAQQAIEDFIHFIIENVELNEAYEPLHIFEGVRNYPLRVKCVLLSWRTLENILQQKIALNKNDNTTTTTETD